MPADYRYDWDTIARFYEEGHSVRDCRRRFGFSNGAWDAAVKRGNVRPRPRSVRVNASAGQRAVAELLGGGMSQAAVARALGISPATVSYHARQLGRAPRLECARRYDWDAVRAYYDEGHSVRECRARFGMCSRTFNDAVRRGAIVTRPQAMPIADLLVAGAARNRCHVKTRLLGAGLKAKRCEGCGIEKWRGLPLSLELHHVNGDGNDNRLQNLRLLCPNCHSQTENWGGRGKRTPREQAA